MDTEQIDANKKAATEFLKMIVAGQIDEAYKKYIDMHGDNFKHHNSFTPAGFEALREGMKGASAQFPNMKSEVQRVLGDGDLVAVHSHMTLQEKTADFAAVHIFRFAEGKIVEIWDMSQAIDPKSPNTDGVF